MEFDFCLPAFVTLVLFQTPSSTGHSCGKGKKILPWVLRSWRAAVSAPDMLKNLPHFSSALLSGLMWHDTFDSESWNKILNLLIKFHKNLIKLNQINLNVMLSKGGLRIWTGEGIPCSRSVQLERLGTPHCSSTPPCRRVSDSPAGCWFEIKCDPNQSAYFVKLCLFVLLSVRSAGICIFVFVW